MVIEKYILNCACGPRFYIIKLNLGYNLHNYADRMIINKYKHSLDQNVKLEILV